MFHLAYMAILVTIVMALISLLVSRMPTQR